MLLNPRTPLIVGILLVATLGFLVLLYSPKPRHLSSVHAQIGDTSSFESCSTCHASGGLSAGCLACHDEIQSQLNAGSGYHHFLMQSNDSCADCHAEHGGAHLPLTTEASWGAQVEGAFKHPHMDEFLTGKHVGLPCADCHIGKRDVAIALEKFPALEREKTFLGLKQDCVACHEDVHSPGLSGSCDACHGQEAFRPTESFDHTAHLPLAGGHQHLECDSCHKIPAASSVAANEHPGLPFPFDETRGQQCADCHNSPHIAPFPTECEQCHGAEEAIWKRALAHMTPEFHALTGFRLDDPHAQVACEKCHDPGLAYRERHPNPAAPGYARAQDSCHGCHEDVHQGQFAGRYGQCLDCHQRHSFTPTTFRRSQHDSVYQLTGAHEAVVCTECHVVDSTTQARKFVGTSRLCKGCHPDQHAGQFEEIAKSDCTFCHSPVADTFEIAIFNHALRTGYALEGGHKDASCDDCHAQVLPVPESPGTFVRQYRNTSQECSTCHKDVHHGQFLEKGQTICSGCHVSFSDWKSIEFDHNTGSRFPLEGAHTDVACGRCHQRTTLDSGVEVVQFKPLGTQCKDCHEIPSAPAGPVR